MTIEHCYRDHGGNVTEIAIFQGRPQWRALLNRLPAFKRREIWQMATAAIESEDPRVVEALAVRLRLEGVLA